MDSLPNCTVANMSDKYWTCGTPGHIHPVLGDQVVLDDSSFSDRSAVCPYDLQSMVTEDKIAGICGNLNWGCYQNDCYFGRHYNSYENPTCSLLTYCVVSHVVYENSSI